MTTPRIELSWQVKPFDFLTLRELYAVLQLRGAVFVVEQNCVWQDADGKDFRSYHLLGTDAIGELAAYARIMPPGLVYPEASIGRVVTASWARGAGAGRELMQRAMDFVQRQYGNKLVRIGAQKYLTRFYQSFGFNVVGEEYLEDGIPHVEMIASV